MPRIIIISPKIVIRNLESLSRGTGARYLEVIESHIEGEYVAKCWRRMLPKSGTVIDMEAGA